MYPNAIWCILKISKWFVSDDLHFECYHWSCIRGNLRLRWVKSTSYMLQWWMSWHMQQLCHRLNGMQIDKQRQSNIQLDSSNRMATFSIENFRQFIGHAWKLYYIDMNLHLFRTKQAMPIRMHFLLNLSCNICKSWWWILMQYQIMVIFLWQSDWWFYTIFPIFGCFDCVMFSKLDETFLKCNKNKNVN